MSSVWNTSVSGAGQTLFDVFERRSVIGLAM